MLLCVIVWGILKNTNRHFSTIGYCLVNALHCIIVSERSFYFGGEIINLAIYGNISRVPGACPSPQNGLFRSLKRHFFHSGVSCSKLRWR